VLPRKRRPAGRTRGRELGSIVSRLDKEDSMPPGGRRRRNANRAVRAISKGGGPAATTGKLPPRQSPDWAWRCGLLVDGLHGQEVLDASPGRSPLVIAGVVNERVAANRGRHIGDRTGGGRCR
jgi:hypothetical protein